MYDLMLSDVASVALLDVAIVLSSMMSVTLTAPVPLKLLNSTILASTVPLAVILTTPVRLPAVNEAVPSVNVPPSKLPLNVPFTALVKEPELIVNVLSENVLADT